MPPPAAHPRPPTPPVGVDSSEDEGVGDTLICSDENDTPTHLTPTLISPAHDTPTASPARPGTTYYCPRPPTLAPSPLPTLAPTPLPAASSDYESAYYVGGLSLPTPMGSGGPTPTQRGLPPLPSRTDRFKNYFSMERPQGGRRRGRGRGERGDPQYENLHLM